MSRTATRSSGRVKRVTGILPGVSLGRYCMSGMENSAPSFTPEGQREVTVLVFV